MAVRAEVKVDISGALRKTQMLKSIPLATKTNLAEWGMDTVKALKRSAMNMQKSARKSGALARSVGMRLIQEGDGWRLEIGTGVGTTAGSRSAEKYALIQDRGGITHPTVTSKMRKFGWAMYYKTGDDKFKAIALTKKQKLDVRIPASLWFTSVWEWKLSFLNQNYLNDKAILRTAEKIGGGHAG